LLSPSLSCTLIKFSIQKGSQIQRLVNESQWPWSEQFNWQAEEGRRGKKVNKSQGQGNKQCLASRVHEELKRQWSFLKPWPRNFHSTADVMTTLLAAWDTVSKATRETAPAGLPLFFVWAILHLLCPTHLLLRII
jgi:hypothetical protein